MQNRKVTLTHVGDAKERHSMLASNAVKVLEEQKGETPRWKVDYAGPGE